MTEVARVLLESGGKRLSALRATADAPRGLIIALHGGAHDGQYWHHPSAPHASLPMLGAQLGFDVVAVDRPGYGGSLDSFPHGASMEEQVDIIHDIVRTLGAARRLPVFLIGHSLGAVLSLMAAGDSRSSGIVAIDVAGAPLRFSAEQDQGIRASVAEMHRVGASIGPVTPPEMIRAMFFGRDGSFDPAVITHDPVDHRPVMAEIAQVVNFPAVAQHVTEKITLPVQWTFAAQEASSILTTQMPGAVRRWLASSIDARTMVQRDSGHNISLHHVGRAYHLRALAFFEEMAARLKGEAKWTN